MYVSIDVLVVIPGARLSALEGHTAITARALLVLVACALQRLALLSGEAKIPLDHSTLEDLIESFSFSEIRKRTMSTRLCTVLCDTKND